MPNKKDKKNKEIIKNVKEKKKNRSDGQFVEHRQNRWSLVVLLSIIVIVVSLFWIPAELHYTITETYTFSAEDSTKVDLAVLIPTSGNIQEVFDPEITWPGTWEKHTDGRLNVLRLSAEIEAGETIEAVIQYRLNLWQGEASWVGHPVLLNDLESSEDIQSEAPDIIAQADQLRVENNIRLTAKNIFDFTIRHLVWPEETPSIADPGALTALQTGIGGASEQANLMTALSRAADIPSRTVSGLAIPEIIPFFPVSAVWNHPAEPHVWTEVLLADAWIIADPGLSGHFYKRDLFGWTDGKHLTYDETTHLNNVYETLITEAENDGTWNASMFSPIRFVAWSEAAIEDIEISPIITIRKTWDGRLIMIAAVILILMVLNWLYEGEKRRSTGNQPGKNGQKSK